jgi:oligoribonuclease NrnB/cAMP/cGMP phosphodiesterase (DHH superfamily)
MSHTPIIDVFNGDADGICALHQLRLAQPASSTLITGVKRDIALLKQVPPQAGIQVNVFDISLDANIDALQTLLDHGASIRYFDHHAASKQPVHPGLRSYIDEAPDVCSSLLVDRYQIGRAHG